MAFLSTLQQADHEKKAGNLIKSADWNQLVEEVINLGVAKVDRDGDTIQGELRVTGKTWLSGVLSVAGNVGIGTPNPRGLLEVSGPNQTGTGTIKSSGTTVTGTSTLFVGELQVGDRISVNGQTRTITEVRNDLTLIVDQAFSPAITTAASFTIARLGLLVNNGNTGIGTAEPAVKLTISGPTSTAQTEATGILRLIRPAGSGGTRSVDLRVGRAGDGGEARLEFALSGAPGASNTQGAVPDVTVMTLLGAGNVGIGTPNPRGRLEVSGPNQPGNGTITSNGTTVTGTAFTTQLQVGDRITANGQTRTITAVTDNSNLTVDSAFSQDLPSATSFTIARLGLLVNNGNVGIGTASPKAKLSISGPDASAVNDTKEMLRLIRPTTTTAKAKSVDLKIGTFLDGTVQKARLDIALSGEPSASNSNGAVPNISVMTLLGNGNVGIGTPNPIAKLSIMGPSASTAVETKEVLRLIRPGISSVKNSNSVDLRVGAFETGISGRTQLDIALAGIPGDDNGWGSVPNVTVMSLRSNGNVGIGTATPRSALDTGSGVMTGAANDYVKAQFALSGGGTVTWSWDATTKTGRLKWTKRFLAIAMEYNSSFSVGHVNIEQPTVDIPAANVYDGQTRSVSTNDGVLLKEGEALYAVHTVGGNQSAVTFQICVYNQRFIAPSNWLLVAVINHDDYSIKLGTGTIVGANSMWSADAINFKGGNVGLGVTSTSAKLTIQGVGATNTVETKELLRLMRPAVNNVHYANSVDLRVGSFATTTTGGTRLDIAMTGTAHAQNNSWGTVPDVTVMTLLGSGNVGIGTASPNAKLDVNGNVKVSGETTLSDALLFGDNLGQRINFWQKKFGIGVQHATHYFRTQDSFAWYKGGSHSDTAVDPGAQGTVQMVINASGNVGIGTASPGEKLEVNGTVKAAQFSGKGTSLTALPASQLTGTLDAARIPELAASKITSGGTMANTLTIVTNGNVGIGTTDPQAKLEVNGTLKVAGVATLNGDVTIGTSTANRNLTVNGAVTANSFRGSGAGLTGLEATQIPVLDASKITTGTLNVDRIPNLPASKITAGTLAGTLTLNNDRVGIGTTNPQAKLDVNGALKVAGAITLQGDVTIGETNATKTLTVTGATTLNANVTIATGKTLTVTGATTLNGKVGIGTAAPGEKLTVWVEDDTTDLVHVLKYKQGNQSYLKILNNGNVGIGTTDPGSSKLKIANSSDDFADIRFYDSGMGQLEICGWANGWNINTKAEKKHLYLNRDAKETSNILIGRTGKELFVRGSDGNVGIGTTEPQAKLSINGPLSTVVNETQAILRLIRPAGAGGARSADIRVGRAGDGGKHA